jgi:hypothetical protein
MNRTEIEEALMEHKSNKEVMEMVNNEYAAELFYLYKAYIEKGFTESQAFKLIKIRVLDK